MKPIRVLEMFMGFALEGPLGGAERFGIELCRALDKTKIQPIACGLWHFGTPFEKHWMNVLEKEGVPAFTTAKWDGASPYKSFVKAMQGLLRELKGKQVDIIHSHTQFTDIAGITLKRMLNAKALVRTVHNEREWPKRPLRRLILTNLIYPLIFDLEIGVSKQTVDNLNARPPIKLIEKEAICIYNSINLKRFESLDKDRDSINERLNLPKKEKIIGSVGRLTKQKGYDYFIESARLVLEKAPRSKFVIVGGGELVEQLTEQIERLDLTEKIILTGPQQNIEKIFSVMDVFVSSSLWEGLPTVILESFAAGVPVVATNVSGSRELIQSGYNGLLVDPASANQLAEAILLLLEDGDMASGLANNAKKKLDRFSISVIAQQYADLYADLMENFD